MHFPSAARDRGPAFTIREKLASREDLDSAPSDAPGPGEYYGEYREDDLAVLAGERRGVTITGRTPAAGADAASFGSASPGPAYYVGPWTRADLERGPAISFQPPMASGRDAPGGPLDAVERNADVPGPGYYAPEVFQFPIKDAPEGNVGPGGEFLWAPKGYTFGWRGAYGEEGVPREENVSPGPGEYYPDADDDGVYGFAGTGSTPWRPAPGVTIGVRPRETPVRRSRSSPGPGEYYRPTDGSIGAAGARGPKRGARIEDRRTWETQKRKEKKSGCPRAHRLRRAELRYEAAHGEARARARHRRAPRRVRAEKKRGGGGAGARRVRNREKRSSIARRDEVRQSTPLGWKEPSTSVRPAPRPASTSRTTRRTS
jgi:collagen type III alpha